MIRRSPTRIELKLEDLTDFDYIQKFDKKKAPNALPGAVGGISAAEAQKFMRQDRIGFRPIRAGTTTTGSGGGGSSGTAYSTGTNTGTPVAVDVIPGVMTAEASTTTAEVQGNSEGTSTGTLSTPTTTGNGAGGGGNRSANNVAEMDVTFASGAVTPSFTTAESNNASNVDMSLDESL